MSEHIMTCTRALSPVVLDVERNAADLLAKQRNSAAQQADAVVGRFALVAKFSDNALLQTVIDAVLFARASDCTRWTQTTNDRLQTAQHCRTSQTCQQALR